jgi:DNA-binding MarR family transcriptional regulator
MDPRKKECRLTKNDSTRKLLVMQTKNQDPSVAALIEDSMQNLRRIFKAVESYSRTVETKFGMTGPQLWALWELGRTSPLSLKDLAASMHLSPSTVVGVIDRLIAKDLVTREPDQADRRRVCLSLSSKGRELLDQAPNPAQDQLIKGLKSLDPGQLKTLSRSLESLVKTMAADKLEAPFFFAEE